VVVLGREGEIEMKGAERCLAPLPLDWGLRGSVFGLAGGGTWTSGKSGERTSEQGSRAAGQQGSRAALAWGFWAYAWCFGAWGHGQRATGPLRQELSGGRNSFWQAQCDFNAAPFLGKSDQGVRVAQRCTATEQTNTDADANTNTEVRRTKSLWLVVTIMMKMLRYRFRYRLAAATSLRALEETVVGGWDENEARHSSEAKR
jgi:hypothetical protein